MAHILIIDDEVPLRTVLAQILSDAGHTVSQAEDGRQATDLLRCTSVDLVITDIVMAELDGIELIIALRHQFPALPVIAMSGACHNASLYLEIAMRLGARRTLSKPFTANVLLTAVDELLERVCAA